MKHGLWLSPIPLRAPLADLHLIPRPIDLWASGVEPTLAQKQMPLCLSVNDGKIHCGCIALADTH